MARISSIAVLTVCLLLAGCSGGRQASEEDLQGGTLGINLVRGHEVSCAYDPWGSHAADLVVTVKVDGKTVIFAGSDGTDDPMFGVFAAVTPKEGGSRVEVTVADDEGGGEMASCDVAKGAERTAVFTWDGSRTTKVLRGDDSEAAEVFLELGEAPEMLTAASARGTAADSAEFTWTAAGDLDEVLVVYQPGQVAKRAGGDSAEIDGLCDGMSFQARVIGVQGDWHIGRVVAFETPNARPEPPRVLSANATGSMLRVEWENPSPHDAQKFELYVGASGFSPSAATLRSTESHPGIYWSESASVTKKAGDAQVVVRTIDTHGASSDSAAFRIGSPVREETTFGMERCSGPGAAPGFP